MQSTARTNYYEIDEEDLEEYLEGLIPHEELEDLDLDSVISLLKDVGRVTIGGFVGYSDFHLLFLCDI